MSDEFELTPNPLLRAGAWANITRVHAGREQVTIDFGVLDPIEPNTGTLVARITLTIGAAFELRDGLVDDMRGYTEGGNPPTDWTD